MCDGNAVGGGVLGERWWMVCAGSAAAGCVMGALRAEVCWERCWDAVGRERQGWLWQEERRCVCAWGRMEGTTWLHAAADAGAAAALAAAASAAAARPRLAPRWHPHGNATAARTAGLGQCSAAWAAAPPQRAQLRWLCEARPGGRSLMTSSRMEGTGR